jgi:hypothetical protein
LANAVRQQPCLSVVAGPATDTPPMQTKGRFATAIVTHGFFAAHLFYVLPSVFHAFVLPSSQTPALFPTCDSRSTQPTGASPCPPATATATAADEPEWETPSTISRRPPHWKSPRGCSAASPRAVHSARATFTNAEPLGFPKSSPHSLFLFHLCFLIFSGG